MNRSLKIMSTAALWLVCGFAFPETIGFSSIEGFTSGKANNQNGLLAQAGITIEAEGAGLARIPGIGFQRLLMYSNQPEVDTANLKPGEKILFIAFGVTVERPADNIPTLVFGLTDTLDLGKANVKLGGQIYMNSAGDLLLDESRYERDDPIDTGVDIGQAFDLRVEIIKNENGTFDAISSVGSVVKQTDFGVTLDSSPALVLQALGAGQKSPGSITVDMVSIGEPPVVEPPEPE